MSKRMLVQIEWLDIDDGWQWFYLLKVRPGRVKLKGADDPKTGGKHDGDRFWTSITAIKSLRYAENSER